MDMNLVPHTIELIGFVILLVLCVYSFRLLVALGGGLMERAWRCIAVGAILFFVAEIAYLLSGYFWAGNFNGTNIGAVLDTLGGFMLLLGVRAHLKVWTIPKDESRRNTIER